ncbi:MAG: ATP synthase F1 subunit epsilon, partial [Oscillospiraceae bacterium]
SDGLFFDGDVDMIITRTKNGDVGIKAGHIGLVTTLDIGRLKIFNDDEIKEAAVSGGFLKMLKKDGATIVTATAEWAKDIDIDRAKLSAQKAKEKLEAIKDDQKAQMKAEIKLKRAINRINIAK